MPSVVIILKVGATSAWTWGVIAVASIAVFAWLSSSKGDQATIEITATRRPPSVVVGPH